MSTLRSDLWIQLCMCKVGTSIEVWKTKRDEAVARTLRSKGLITGKRWVKLTPLGNRVRNEITIL